MEATLMEVFRMSSLVPMGLPHSTTQDVTFQGFSIPKHTLVFGNFYSVHFDDEIWGDPMVGMGSSHFFFTFYK
jgi:cytochrome P450